MLATYSHIYSTGSTTQCKYDDVDIRTKALEQDYPTIQSLSGITVVHSRRAGYKVFASPRAFAEQIISGELPPEYHEVIFDGPQKLKFDIDASADKLRKLPQPHTQATDGHAEYTAEDPNSDDDRALAELLGIGFDDTIVDTAEVDAPEVGNTPNTPSHPSGASDSVYTQAFDSIYDAIVDTFYSVFGMDPKTLICASHGDTPEGYKYSNHIIIPGYYLPGSAAARGFTKLVLSAIPLRYRQLLDVGVNKSLQEFRVLGCGKDGAGRVKTMLSDGAPTTLTTNTILGSMIANVSGCELLVPAIPLETGQKTRATDETLTEEELLKVMEFVRGDKSFTNYRVRRVIRGMVVFERIPGYQSVCEFCDDVHVKDANYVVSTTRTGSTISVYKMCRKYIDRVGKDGSHVVCIGMFNTDRVADGVNPGVGNAPNTPQAIPDAPDARLTRTDGIIRKVLGDLEPGKPRVNLLTGVAGYPPECLNEYSEAWIRPLELVPTLVVHAQMKMGKTKALRDYIDAHFAAGGLRTPVIRIISFRQTFSINVNSVFDGFTLYSDVRGPLDQPRLIVQVESLWRLEVCAGTEPPDLVILDESESILEQFGSGLMGGAFHECYAKFRWLVGTAKHVIALDANITDRTLRSLAEMREQPAVYHHNVYQKAAGDTYMLCGDLNRWLAALYALVDAGKHVAIAASSLSEAEAVVREIGRRLPEARVKLYSSKTLASERREHFSDVNLYWAQYDVLVFTPTVSAGVSFEIPHYDVLFGYFTDQSCPVETCIQMLGRIRDIGTRHTVIYFDARGNNLPTKPDDIRELLRAGQMSLGNNYAMDGLTVAYSADGTPEYAGAYLPLWVENTRAVNLSRNMFIRLFMQYIDSYGATLYHFDDDRFQGLVGRPYAVAGETAQEFASHLAIHREHKINIRVEYAEETADALELSDEQAAEIRDAAATSRDVSHEERVALDKYKLRAIYDHREAMSPEFVLTYSKSDTQRHWRNLGRVGNLPADTAIKVIQAEERDYHDWLISMGAEVRDHDMNRVKIFDQHRYALAYMKLAGWTSLVDPQWLHETQLQHNLSSEQFWKHAPEVCLVYGMKMPSRRRAHLLSTAPSQYCAFMLGFIDKMLNYMYGCRIKATTDPGLWRLIWNPAFAVSSILISLPVSLPAEAVPEEDNSAEIPQFLLTTVGK